jgi:hypothetical protein
MERVWFWSGNVAIIEGSMALAGMHRQYFPQLDIKK